MPSSLLALLDDIATTLDDVAAMTKVAAKKTAGVLGDDLALNAQQVSGASAERELPIVWAVAKGSFINKMILIPAALLTSFAAPWAVLPLLMMGGAYLCYEGVEKLAHAFAHRPQPAPAPTPNPPGGQSSGEGTTDPQHAHEKQRVRGAIRTDFILSAEIIVITLGSVASASFGRRALTLYAIGLVMTVGVYGLVALIVKADDFGEHLARKQRGWHANLGRGIVRGAPVAMRSLSVVGTAAMFLVGGSLIVHGLPRLHHGISHVADQAGWLRWAVSSLLEGLVAVVAGSAILLVVAGWRRLRRKPAL
jgi:predicted DNA repair protein MutK